MVRFFFAVFELFMLFSRYILLLFSCQDGFIFTGCTTCCWRSCSSFQWGLLSVENLLWDSEVLILSFSCSSFCLNFDASVFTIVPLLIFRALKELDQDSLFHVEPINEGCFQQLLNHKTTILDQWFNHVLHTRNTLFRFVLFLLGLLLIPLIPCWT